MKTSLILAMMAVLITPLFISCEDHDSYTGSIYIVSRNSESKEGNLVLKYNQSGQKISHIGIAFSNEADANVYNISYGQVNGKNSALLSETISEFWSSPNQEDNQIWKFTISEAEYHGAKTYIELQQEKELYFDFSQDTELGMYCSEFVYSVLQNANPNRFKMEPVCNEMKGFERIATNQDYFCYYPADFFLPYIHLGISK